MPVHVVQLRDELLPGLYDIGGSYETIPRQWDRVFALHGIRDRYEAIAIPLSVTVAAGAAAVVIRNPTVSRRSLFSWGLGNGRT